jgi:hypothetical protein
MDGKDVAYSTMLSYLSIYAARLAVLAGLLALPTSAARGQSGCTELLLQRCASLDVESTVAGSLAPVDHLTVSVLSATPSAEHARRSPPGSRTTEIAFAAGGLVAGMALASLAWPAFIDGLSDDGDGLGEAGESIVLPFVGLAALGGTAIAIYSGYRLVILLRS